MKSQPVWAAVVMEGEIRGESSWASRLGEDTKAGPSPPATLPSLRGAQHFLTCHRPRPHVPGRTQSPGPHLQLTELTSNSLCCPAVM